jgi:hypothetical protein
MRGGRRTDRRNPFLWRAAQRAITRVTKRDAWSACVADNDGARMLAAAWITEHDRAVDDRLLIRSEGIGAAIGTDRPAAPALMNEQHVFISISLRSLVAIFVDEDHPTVLPFANPAMRAGGTVAGTADRHDLTPLDRFAASEE